MPEIRPTHTCFDDAMRFLEHLGLAALITHLDDYVVVHAECLIGGQPYAHAWVEHVVDSTDEGPLVWQAGYFDGEFMFYACRKTHLAFQVRRAWRYSVREAVARNYDTGHFGPWAPELDALCGDGTSCKILGAVDVTVHPDALKRGMQHG